MRKIIIHIILMQIVGQAYSVDQSEIVNQQRFIHIFPLYQSWSDTSEAQFSEFTIPFSAYFPLNRNLSVDVKVHQAIADGDHLQKVSGMTDTQVSFNYYVESIHVVFNLGLNVPSGKKELTLEEFMTSLVLSSHYYNFCAPNFGQGLNITPGLTWAKAIADNLVLGLGASYQYKGEFKPLKGMSDAYNPGDEFLLTGGLDARLNDTMSLSADLVYINYMVDELGKAEVFVSGDVFLGNVQLRKYFNHHILRILSRYRSKAKNQLAVGGTLIDEQYKTIPNLFELIFDYRARINEVLSANILAELRVYQKMQNLTGVHLFGVGIAPELTLNQNFKMPLRCKYQIGAMSGGAKIHGFEFGLGIFYSF